MANSPQSPSTFRYQAWHSISVHIFMFNVFMFGAYFLSGCLNTNNLPTPTPSSTSTPAPTPSATPVWFPTTATPTPFPTRVITPTQDLSPQYGPLLFSDSFDDPAVWNLIQTRSSSVALGNQSLTLALDQPDGYLFSLRREPQLIDFYLEITARTSLCRNEDEYGLLLRVSPALDFYRYSLSCDGKLRLDKYYQGQASSPQPWVLSGSVPPGAPGESRLGVLAKGKELTFYINGEYQFAFRDPTIMGGSFGVFVRSAGENAVTVSFSDLEVYSVP